MQYNIPVLIVALFGLTHAFHIPDGTFSASFNSSCSFNATLIPSPPDISAPPFPAISAPPFPDISAPPFPDISAPPCSDISAPPFPDISAPPCSDISAPPFPNITLYTQRFSSEI